MPTLTDSQLQQLLAELNAREAQLGSEVRAASQDEADSLSMTDGHAEVEDFGERGEHRLRSEMRFAEKERDIDELLAIAAAKERMARGAYGECVGCSVDIPLARLRVSPASSRCLACQEKFEQAHPVGLRILQTP